MLRSDLEGKQKVKSPSYHLRPNKSVDRLALIEAIRYLEKTNNISEYTYYGLGGPYLEDFRLLYEFCPGIKMVSIEENPEVFKRQNFHLPCGSIKLERSTTDTFLTNYQAKGKKSIFWLDYTGFEYKHIEEYMALLSKVTAGSMVKITLRAEPKDYIDKGDNFRKMFESIMPDSSVDPPRVIGEYAKLIQDMIQIATQRALSGAMPNAFQPLSSFYYSDGTGIFTITGMVCLREDVDIIKSTYKDWRLANLNWNNPKKIDIPILSTKERLLLQRHLPSTKNTGELLLDTLGYLIDENREKTVDQLEQYSEFHRYSPYFMRATP